MKNILILFLLINTTCLIAQERTDTVKQGYYLLLNKNVVSCKVKTMEINGNSTDTTIHGNQMPACLIQYIGAISKGTVITYYEITTLENGVLTKAPLVQYIIGSVSTKPEIRSCTAPILIHAKNLAELELDSTIISFRISLIKDGKTEQYSVKGRRIPDKIKKKIIEMQPGQKVDLLLIIAKDTNGNSVKLPQRQFEIE
ncbi:hypothetical protein BH09BAC5_BH09BAC5_04430 [soil metagenome]